MREKTVSVPCDLCGSLEHDVVLVKEGYPHVRCRVCSMVFVNPRLAGHREIQSRTGTGTMGEESLTSAQTKRLEREVAELESFRRLNVVLEVGPGKGWFLRVAKTRGWRAWAVEINESALDNLKNLDIERLIEGAAETFVVPRDSVDVVRMWDVIEHLESPTSAVGNIHRALRPGGLLRVATTNFASLSRWVNGPEWVYLNGADHIHLFEPRTIVRLLETQGFGRVSIRTKSFNLRRKLYHPELALPPGSVLLRPFRKIIDEAVGFTRYGHQMIVSAVKI
jgi:SAM-dependent methyltransferase